MTTQQPITFLAALDRLNEDRAVFSWNQGELTRDQFERGQVAARVVVEAPRREWEKAGRPVTVTLHLADLSSARIDQPDALARAWADGYASGKGDLAASQSAQKSGENAGITVNPYGSKR